MFELECRKCQVLLETKNCASGIIARCPSCAAIFVERSVVVAVEKFVNQEECLSLAKTIFKDTQMEPSGIETLSSFQSCPSCKELMSYIPETQIQICLPHGVWLTSRVRSTLLIDAKEKSGAKDFEVDDFDLLVAQDKNDLPINEKPEELEIIALGLLIQQIALQ